MIRKIGLKFCNLVLIVVEWGQFQNMDNFVWFYTQLYAKTTLKKL